MTARYLTPALGVAGATFVLLFVILSMPLWIAFVATGGAIGVYLVGAGTVLIDSERATSPIGELVAAPLTAGGLLSAAGALVVMHIVLGIALWISILGAFGVLAGVAVVESLVSLPESSSRGARVAVEPSQLSDSPGLTPPQQLGANGDAEAPRPRREPAAA